MAETIPGGAYLAEDGVTWKDADGRPLKPEQVKAAKALADQQAKEAETMQALSQSPEAVAARLAAAEKRLAELEGTAAPAAPAKGRTSKKDDDKG